MKRLSLVFVGIGLLMLVGCESSPSAADDAAMRKRLSNGPPTMPGADAAKQNQQDPKMKGARQDERMAQQQGQQPPAGR